MTLHVEYLSKSANQIAPNAKGSLWLITGDVNPLYNLTIFSKQFGQPIYYLLDSHMVQMDDLHPTVSVGYTLYYNMQTHVIDIKYQGYLVAI